MNNDFFLNKQNIGSLFNIILKKYNLPTSENYKAALIQVIVNEMKIIYNKIDRNKLASKTPNEINLALSQLNNIIIDNIKSKLPSINTPQQPVIIPQRPTSSNNMSIQSNFNRENLFAPVPVQHNNINMIQQNMNTRKNITDYEKQDNGTKNYEEYLAER